MTDTDTTPAAERKNWAQRHPIVTTVVAVTIGVIVFAGGSGDEPTAADPSPEPAVIAPEPVETVDREPAAEPVAAEPEPAPVADPKPRDFTIELKILEQDCFGSAGCNLLYRPELTYEGTVPLDPDETYEITYRIKGGDDPKISTLTVTEGDIVETYDETIGTPTTDTDLDVKVTDVSTLGL
jgi:hypothetical protein